MLLYPIEPIVGELFPGHELLKDRGVSARLVLPAIS
jgi:hypothetical protein